MHPALALLGKALGIRWIFVVLFYKLLLTERKKHDIMRNHIGVVGKFCNASDPTKEKHEKTR